MKRFTFLKSLFSSAAVVAGAGNLQAKPNLEELVPRVRGQANPIGGRWTINLTFHKKDIDSHGMSIVGSMEHSDNPIRINSALRYIIQNAVTENYILPYKSFNFTFYGISEEVMKEAVEKLGIPIIGNLDSKEETGAFITNSYAGIKMGREYLEQNFAKLG